MIRAIFYWCYLIVLAFGLIVGWEKIASIDGTHWGTFSPMEKKAISELVSDKYFSTYEWCSQAQFRIVEGTETEFYARCVERGC